MSLLFNALLCQVLSNLERDLPSQCPQPPSVSLAVDVTAAEMFQPVTLSWSSKRATSCNVGGEWSGKRDVEGNWTTTFDSPGKKELSITCNGPNGTATRSVLIDVLQTTLQTGETVAKNGARFFADIESNSLFHIPILNHSSLRKHQGTIYPNSSTGESVEIPAGFYGDLSVDCEVANLNGDEFPDAVMISMPGYYANESSKEVDIINPERRPRVHFLINSGLGYFESGQHLLPGEAHHRINIYKDIQVADLNNDGLDDLLFSSEGGGSELLRDDGILLLISNSDGTYSDSTHNMDFTLTPVDRGEFTEDVFQIQAGLFVPMDVNNDNLVDLFISGLSRGLSYPLPSVFLNQGDETFTPWSNFDGEKDLWNFTEWVMWRAGEVLDFDSDGDDDVAFLCYQPNCFNEGTVGYEKNLTNGFILLNQDGQLSLDSVVPFPPGLFGQANKNDSIDSGDINGDGFPDIVLVSGKQEPYYVNRNIQILINHQGQYLADETKTRIDDARTDESGHAEGLLHLVDFDADGDLDIFDHQQNVRNGVNTSADESLGNSRRYPYFSNGGALFLNDGDGVFTAESNDLHDASGLKKINWAGSNQASYNLNSLYAPWKVCPIDFGGDFGIGFLLGTYHWTGVFDDPSPSEGSTMSIGSVRQLRSSDKELLKAVQ